MSALLRASFEKARAEALAAGIEHYNGAPCARCGRSKRLTANRHCLTCKPKPKRQSEVAAAQGKKADSRHAFSHSALIFGFPDRRINPIMK